jgi:hypothetical protein
MPDSFLADFSEWPKFKSAVLRVFTIHNTFWMDSRSLDIGNIYGWIILAYTNHHLPYSSGSFFRKPESHKFVKDSILKKYTRL